MTRRSLVGICCAGAVLGACHTAAPLPHESARGGNVPAVIARPTPESRAELQQAVSRMLSGAEVLLADDAFTGSSLLTIERRRLGSRDNPPLSGRDLGTPERFRLLLTGTGCVLLRESDESTVALPETDCVPEK